MARVPPLRIIPAFIVGKSTSDLLYLLGGEYALQNSSGLLDACSPSSPSPAS